MICIINKDLDFIKLFIHNVINLFLKKEFLTSVQFFIIYLQDILHTYY